MLVRLDDPEAFDLALKKLRASEAIAFPTDTVYGVGALALNASAVQRLFAIKRRPFSQPIPLLIADQGDLAAVASQITPLTQRLMQLWPGALTLVVPAAPHLPSVLLSGGTTVAVRLPDHAWLRSLIRALGAPLAATSANIHGQPDPQTAADVSAQLGDNVGLVLDGGPTPGLVPSTIVDCTGAQPKVLRAGALSVEQILRIES